MKQLIGVAVMALCVAALSYAQGGDVVIAPMKAAVVGDGQMSMHGYLVDAMCAKGMMKNPAAVMKKAAAHTKECALHEHCASSGYGIMSEGKWFKFDEKGDKEAKAFIENTKMEKALMVEVTGEMSGEVFALASIQEHAMKSDAKEVDSKSEKKSEIKAPEMKKK